jgi:2-polyprenyl-3-methyl-5-hydroxy-6-metoxy-1,4-benzoquinol methylase
MEKINLENNGERMDIDFYSMDYNGFDGYQKSHYKRYEFATTKLNKEDIVGDMACGSGYGSMMLSKNCKEVQGYDIDEITVNEIKKRYINESNINFGVMNLLDITDENKYDKIISFETVEHFTPEEIKILMSKFHKALKKDGRLIFSTPYNQERSIFSMKFHKTFYITEDVIKEMVKGLFEVEQTHYQDYDTHEFKGNNGVKHFIICEVKKI